MSNISPNLFRGMADKCEVIVEKCKELVNNNGILIDLSEYQECIDEANIRIGELNIFIRANTNTVSKYKDMRDELLYYKDALWNINFV